MISCCRVTGGKSTAEGGGGGYAKSPRGKLSISSNLWKKFFYRCEILVWKNRSHFSVDGGLSVGTTKEGNLLSDTVYIA